MERLMDIVVKFAQKKKEGEGKYGPWVIYDFKIDAPGWEDIYFGYLTNPDKIIPAVGMRIDVLEYEIEETGEYTNYKVQKLLLPGSSNPKPKPKAKLHGQAPQSSGGQAYINHGEVVCELMNMAQKNEGGEIDRPLYEKLLNAFRYGIRALTSDPPAPKSEPKPKPKPVEEPPPEDDGFPDF